MLHCSTVWWGNIMIGQHYGWATIGWRDNMVGQQYSGETTWRGNNMVGQLILIYFQKAKICDEGCQGGNYIYLIMQVI